MFKEWYSKDKQVVTHLFGRIGTWIASDGIGFIRDRIYILPTVLFYFNHYSWYIGFRWLTLKLDFFREDFNKKERLINEQKKK